MPLKTIVVDTNFVGGGRFAKRTVRFLERLAGPGNFVVVSEVTVWEWAEHASAEIRELRRLHGSVSVLVDDLPVVEDVDQQLACVRIERRLREVRNVSIDTVNGDEAVQAVRAQILQNHPVVELKKGVKTGAADHLVLACLRRAQRKGREVAFCTCDNRLLRSVLKTLPTVKVFTSQPELLHWAFGVPNDGEIPVEVDEGVLAFVERQLVESLGSELASMNSGFWAEIDGELYEDGYCHDNGTRINLRLSNFRDVEVDDLSMLKAEDVVYATSHLRMRGDAQVGLYDSFAEWETDDRVGCSIVVPVLFTLDEHNLPEAIEMIGVVEIFA